MTLDAARPRLPASIYARVAGTAFLLLLVWLCLPDRSESARHLVSDISFVLAPAVAAWRCLRAARRGGEGARTWWLLGIGISAWTLGSVAWAVQELALGRLSPFPSVADVGYLALPVFALAGLFALPGLPRKAASAARLLLDAVATAAALLILAWLGPLGDAVGSAYTGTSHLVAIAFPALDVLVTAAVVVVVDRLRGGLRQPAALAAVGMGLAASCDIAYAILSARTGDSVGGPLDAAWAGSFLLIGLAAGLPAAAPIRPRNTRFHVLPSAPAALAVTALLLSGRLVSGLEPVLAATAVVLVAALAARQQLLVTDNRALHRSLEDRVASRTSELRQAREVYRRRAYTDPLTRLANRDAFSEALAAAARDDAGGHLAVVLLDLDGFKQVNDGFGHAAGDRVLVAVAERLQGCVRGGPEAGQSVARLGGDEFGCLLRGLRSPEDADTVAARFVQAMRESVVVDGHEFFLGASVGVAVATAPLDRPSGELLREADTAMYVAKDAGGNCLRTFDARMHSTVVERIALEADLHRALADQEIRVFYQPIYGLGLHRVTGVEALARWRHPVRGNVSPEVFIPVAERTGMIVELERQVLDQVCAQMAAWRHLVPDLKVGVNFSARHLREPDVVSSVLSCLVRHAVPPAALVAEVTESLFFGDEALVGSVLRELDDAGIVLALDDFGTGFSSLSRLSAHPFRILKVDRSFLADISVGGPPPAILLATLAMARGLGLDVVAEGVETQAQLDFLIEQGCPFAQGYLLRRPGPADEIEGDFAAITGWAARPRRTPAAVLPN
ncbi:MAG: Diguanylate cyclase protein [Frankiales bacterium]|nr:Diguanylate cyclase protein [Frankiales bacterium]